jgi:adenine-specific DNA-methyltransferase
MDERGIYFPDNISGPNHGQYVYDVLHPVTQQVCKAPASGWRYPKDTMDVRIREGRVHFGEDHTTVPNNKTYLKDTEFQSLTSMRFVDGRAASKRLDALFGMKVFTNPKDELLLKDLMKAFGVGGEDIVMDFFAGSGTTGHAVHELNVEQLSACRFILVQFSESLESMLSRATGSAKRVLANAISFLRERDRPLTIAEIAKERLRRCGEQVVSRSAAPLLHSIDVGFRVLRVDTSNMTNVYYTPKSVNQGDLFAHVDNIKEDRKPEDLLFQVLLDTGTDLTLPISSETVHGKKVFCINEDVLAACFETGISEAIVNEIAARRPLQAVFRDSGFDSDSTKINVEQIFKLKSPRTELKVI